MKNKYGIGIEDLEPYVGCNIKIKCPFFFKDSYVMVEGKLVRIYKDKQEGWLLRIWPKNLPAESVHINNVVEIIEVELKEEQPKPINPAVLYRNIIKEE
jgi:hypothetical protein